MRIALVWRGDPQAVPLEFPRLQPIYDALMQIAVTPVPVAFSETSAAEARAQLLSCDGALTWVDPLTDGVDRTQFDALLRDVSSRGVWVSAHPEVILKMGVKEVLVRTKRLGWGTDAYVYDTIDSLRSAFPHRLVRDRVRVLKQNRGNGNQGVWKVELETPSEPIGHDTRVTVLEARENFAESGVLLRDFMGRWDSYLKGGGRLIDQAFQQRVDEGLIRCYMCGDKVIGFSEQFPRNRSLGDSSLPAFGMAREKTMHDESAPQFQGLRRSMEDDWTPGLQAILEIESSDLPVLWDADFLYGSNTSEGDRRFVLCEINVSCVVPYPLTATAAIASAAKERVLIARGRGA